MKFACLILILVAPLAYASIRFGDAKGGSREHYLEKGQVWRKTDIRTLNLLNGPQNEISVPPGTEIRCHYVEWKNPPTGVSPKFKCKLDSGEIVRIKYGKENRETFGEVAASRLFWALGFYSDDVYSVRVHCIGCPENSPFKPEKSERRIVRDFPYAMMEKNYPGFIIEDHSDEGWAWKELEKVKPDQGGASPEQLGALELLAVFVQHGDQKPAQQRIGCAKTDVVYSGKNNKKLKGECMRPVLMVQDLGSTFGRADQNTSSGAKMRFDLWSQLPVWDLKAEAAYYQKTNYKVCIGNLIASATARTDGLDHPVITEPSRKFLADELLELTDTQIHDLFVSARADQTGETIKVDGFERPVTVNDWVQAFKKKRREIVERNCTPM
jgi:hypothetical protein